MDDCINSQIISMDGLLETVKEYDDSLLHHLIFPGNFLIAGDECFMANALVSSRSCENSDDETTTGRGTLESISSDSPYGDN